MPDASQSSIGAVKFFVAASCCGDERKVRFDERCRLHDLADMNGPCGSIVSADAPTT
jgi:hypothetical protein